MEAIQRLVRSLRAARSVELPNDDDAAFLILMRMVMQNQYRPVNELLSAPSCTFDVNKTVGAAECLALLLKRGIDVNAKDGSGVTPLLLAARGGHGKCVHKLIEFGANIHIQANDGLTAVHWVACNGRTELLAELIAKGEYVDVVDSQGQTALHVACQNGHIPAVALLLEKKASVDRPDSYGRTPLLFACRYGQSGCAQLLIKWNAKHLRDNGGSAPIDICIESRYHDCTLLLVDSYPQLLSTIIDMDNAEESNLQAALYRLCQHNQSYIPQILLGLAQKASTAGEELLSLNKDIDYVVPLFLRFLRILCHLQQSTSSFQICHLSSSSVTSRFQVKKHRRSPSLESPSTSRRGSSAESSETIGVVQEASEKSVSLMESLWEVLEQWFLLLANEVSQSDVKTVLSAEPEKPAVAEEPAKSRIGATPDKVASLLVRTTPTHVRRAFLRSVSQSSLPQRGPSTREDEPLGRWSGNWEGWQHGFSRSRHRAVLSPPAADSITGDDTNLFGEVGHLLAGGVIGAFSDRLCAVTHGFYLHCCMCESNARRSRSGMERFVTFADRHEKVLKILLARNPKLIFAHFHFLLELPDLLRRFIHIVRSQPFEERRAWFYENLYRQQTNATEEEPNQANVISVSRDDLFSSSCCALANVDVEKLKKKNTVISFKGEGGMGSGVQREFFDLLSKEILNPDYALFTQSTDGATFQPNSNSSINPDHLSYFLFAGRIIGMALFRQQLLQIYFTRSFFKHILGIPVDYNDVASIDTEYANNLQWILDNDISNLGLELTFSVETDVFGAMQEVDLKPGGSSIAVTEENKEEYVQLVAEMRMTRAIQRQIDSFLRGFHEFIPRSLLSLFDEYELELCLSGVPKIDLEDWKANTEYSGGFDDESPVIKWFWELMASFDRKVQVQVLQFVTGSSRVPLGGFANLVGASGLQKFIVTSSERAAGNSLPTASTCFNLLKLPNYQSKEQLRKCLLIALNCGGLGFEFA
ncbi:E3 ubiquitin-protein ligase HACE1-like isoform X2 [Oscarella lobularis]|uniref:E3 ubiquitin-protein ligase HACE1-like isoform X2 n=1 Tax=Oscarella lobularis TaxID=121494 RepID=UPI0033135CFD